MSLDLMLTNVVCVTSHWDIPTVKETAQTATMFYLQYLLRVLRIRLFI